MKRLHNSNWKIKITILMFLPWAKLRIFQGFFTRSLASEGHGTEFYVIYMCANLHFKPVCAWKLREHIKTWHIIAPCLGGAVFISKHPPRCAFVFQSKAGDPYQALSIIPLTCHHGNPHPTQGRLQERVHRRKLLRCEWMWTWMEGKTTTELRERNDDRWRARMGKRKGAEGGRTMRNQKGDRWLLHREWKKRDGGQKKGWANALIFHTGEFLHTWREASDSKLSCPPLSWIYFVPRADEDDSGKQNVIFHKLNETQRENGERFSRVDANGQIRLKYLKQINYQKIRSWKLERIGFVQILKI